MSRVNNQQISQWNYSRAYDLLNWSRTVEIHGLDFVSWRERKRLRGIAAKSNTATKSINPIALRPSDFRILPSIAEPAECGCERCRIIKSVEASAEAATTHNPKHKKGL